MTEAPSDHPHGILPLGECVATGSSNRVRACGLGRLANLPDELILQILSILSPRSLVILSTVSKALYAFCNNEDLWKTLTLQDLRQEHEGYFTFQASWKDTCLCTSGLGNAPNRQRQGSNGPRIRRERRLKAWLLHDNLPRRNTLTAEKFRQEFERPNIPVVLTDSEGFQNIKQKWTLPYLQTTLQGQNAIAGDMEMRVDDFFQYMARQTDDMPLYLFDKSFADRCPQLAEQYRVPNVFEEDLFEVLGSSRPDYRWLIIGPARSGSSFHIDPNATSAWNATITGRKKWIMFPPSQTPPGVIPSSDGSSVAAPVSIVEWFLNFYEEARQCDPPPLECVTTPGDVMFVPHGWWHCVLNLEPCVAITQNFVSSANLKHVLTVLKCPNLELVSGCDANEKHLLYDRFTAALRAKHPGLLRDWDEEQENVVRKQHDASRLASLFQSEAQQPSVESCGEAAKDKPVFSFSFTC